MWNFVINVKLFHVLSSNIQNNEFSRTIICPGYSMTGNDVCLPFGSDLALASRVATLPMIMNNNSPNHRNLEQS